MKSRSILLVALVLMISVNTFAQGDPVVVAEARRRIAQPPKYTRLENAVVRVPMVGTKTLPLVNVTLNGQGPYKFLVDTGANVTILQMRVADDLNLPVLRPGDKSKLLALRSMEMNGAHFEDVVVGARSWNEDIDGIIGFGIFANLLFTMDYPKQQLILRKGELPATNGKDIFTYGLDARCPTLEVVIGNERLNILVDTGARQAMVITNSIASKLKFAGPLTPGPTLSTFHTDASASRLGKLSDELSMGIHKVAGMKVHVWDDVPVLGSDLFKDFVLTFDQKNLRLRIGV
ncbi:MAG TPA: pepsin/retropepsin-like aspartic protease family protein [Pyrinomonadaceae bacterium]|nr:pepsin/retropepsin-like aspartic protease family protein [Pyrinomonadaceae bacterium]